MFSRFERFLTVSAPQLSNAGEHTFEHHGVRWRELLLSALCSSIGLCVMMPVERIVYNDKEVIKYVKKEVIKQEPRETRSSWGRRRFPTWTRCTACTAR